jgi:phytol kinase
MLNPWAGIAIVMVTFTVLMGALSLCERRLHPDPEWLRKLIHMGMGIVTLTFPWLFSKTWPVWLMSALFAVLLLGLRLLAPLRERYGGIIGGVARQSWGEIYFPVAVGLLFYFSKGDPLLYGVPILILTFADALSALIGTRHGRLRFSTDDGQKSIEGSATFFVVAFLGTLIPLLMFAHMEGWQAVLTASCIGLLCMMVEASAWRGLDNLFIPLAAFIMLQTYLKLTPAEMALRLAEAVIIFLFMLVWRSRTTLKGSALLGAALGVYLCWVVGGWRWLVAPVILVGSYTFFFRQHRRNDERIHDNHVVVAIASVGLAWLWLARILERPDFYYPFTLSFAAHLAMIGMARWKRSAPYLSAAAVVIVCTLLGWVVLFGPYLLVEGLRRRALGAVAMAPLGIGLAAVAFYVIQPGMDDCPNTTARWVRQAAAAALGSAAGIWIVSRS